MRMNSHATVLPPLTVRLIPISDPPAGFIHCSEMTIVPFRAVNSQHPAIHPRPSVEAFCSCPRADIGTGANDKTAKNAQTKKFIRRILQNSDELRTSRILENVGRVVL